MSEGSQLASISMGDIDELLQGAPDFAMEVPIFEATDVTTNCDDSSLLSPR